MNFELSLTPARHLISFLDLKIPFTLEQLYKEFERETWLPHGMVAPVGHDPWPGTRYKVLRPQENNSCLQALSIYFCSDEFKKQLIDWMYDNYRSIDVSWGMNREQLFRCTEVHGEFTKDMPGFVNDIHTDYRKLVATGLIYWAKEDNPDLSSHFYDTITRENPLRIPTGFGKGWFHANGNNTWHDGKNATNELRYSTLIGLTINVTELPKYQ